MADSVDVDTAAKHLQGTILTCHPPAIVYFQDLPGCSVPVWRLFQNLRELT